MGWIVFGYGTRKRKKEMKKMEEEEDGVSANMILTVPRDMGFIGYEDGKFVMASE